MQPNQSYWLMCVGIDAGLCFAVQFRETRCILKGAFRDIGAQFCFTLHLLRSGPIRSGACFSLTPFVFQNHFAVLCDFQLK